MDLFGLFHTINWISAFCIGYTWWILLEHIAIQVSVFSFIFLTSFGAFCYHLGVVIVCLSQIAFSVLSREGSPIQLVFPWQVRFSSGSSCRCLQTCRLYLYREFLVHSSVGQFTLLQVGHHGVVIAVKGVLQCDNHAKILMTLV